MDVNDKDILPGVKHVVLVLSGKGFPLSKVDKIKMISFLSNL